jgi:hypothetical protein
LKYTFYVNNVWKQMFNFGMKLDNFAIAKPKINYMKKKTLLLATVFAASSLFAQDLTSKKGEPYLPEANDWAIAFDAVPFLNYAGQLLSNAGATSPILGSTNNLPFHIRGKMFKDEKTAYRAGLRLGFGNEKETRMIGDASSTSTPTFPALPAMKEDVMKMGATNIVLSGGLEMRRGKTRLQGYYGGELLIALLSSKETYTYGNALSNGTTPVAVNAGTTTNFGTNFTTDTYGNTARITEAKSSFFGFGLRGFIGVEYFILPKISIGGEYGWGLMMGNEKSSSTHESYDVGTNAVGSQTIDGNKTGMFGIDADIQYVTGGTGNLNIIFHF